MTTLPQGQLDEVSRTLGKMEGVVEGLTKYLHDFRHDEANRRQTDLHFQDTMLRNIEKIRADMEAVREKDAHALAAVRLADQQELQRVKDDVAALKAVNTRRDGLLGAVDYVFKSPIIAWVFAAGAALWGLATGKVHL